MTDFSMARRALLAATGSALVLGPAAPAFADGLDAGHLSLNQGAACAVRDVGDIGENVARTGALPEAFNDVKAAPGRADGVRALCHAVRVAPPASGHQGRGLLGGLPAGR